MGIKSLWAVLGSSFHRPIGIVVFGSVSRIVASEAQPFFHVSVSFFSSQFPDHHLHRWGPLFLRRCSDSYPLSGSAGKGFGSLGLLVCSGSRLEHSFQCGGYGCHREDVVDYFLLKSIQEILYLCLLLRNARSPDDISEFRDVVIHWSILIHDLQFILGRCFITDCTKGTSEVCLEGSPSRPCWRRCCIKC